ncbi:hypothetical protein M0804_013964 [Polistes exclamans]|nr:hypothetical protein M0804_013964 [Polistes exclamans]
MFCRHQHELEELLGRFPTLPALVACDFNARSTRLNLHLFNQIGRPTCVWPQGSSVIDLTWSSPAASVRPSEWRVDEAESLSDHSYLVFRYSHETIDVQSSRPQDRFFPRWDTRAVDVDVPAATSISMVEGFFPQVDLSGTSDVRGVQIDGAVVTPEEMFIAAKKIAGGKALVPDGVSGIVEQMSAAYCVQ